MSKKSFSCGSSLNETRSILKNSKEHCVNYKAKPYASITFDEDNICKTFNSRNRDYIRDRLECVEDMAETNLPTTSRKRLGEEGYQSFESRRRAHYRAIGEELKKNQLLN